MSKSFQELLEIAHDIKLFFKVTSYEFHEYEDGSFVDFRVQQVYGLPELLKLAGSLELMIMAGDGYIIVRLYERNYG